MIFFYINSSIQVDRIGSKLLGDSWLGVYSLDKIPYIPVNKAIIVNTHSSNLGGEHWIAVYRKPAKILVFDPFGFYYPSMLVSHLSRLCKTIVYNKVRYQQWFSQNCGQLCLLWLKKQHYS